MLEGRKLLVRDWSDKAHFLPGSGLTQLAVSAPQAFRKIPSLCRSKAGATGTLNPEVFNPLAKTEIRTARPSNATPRTAQQGDGRAR